MRILLGAVLFVAVLSLDCKNYLNYDGNSNHTKEGRCLVNEGDNRYATPCSKSDQVCMESSGLCKTVTVELRLAGQTCVENDDCKYGDCVGPTYHKKCKGNAESTHCGAHDECDVGLHCGHKKDAKNATCEKLKEKDALCEEDQECRQDLACVGKKCKAWFSGVKGEDCTMEPSNPLLSYQCGSGLWCEAGKCSDKLPKNTKTGDCTVDADCTTDVKEAKGTCMCAISTAKSSRCTAMPGDAAVLEAYSLLRKYVAPFASVALNCQTTLKFSADCFQVNADSDVWLGYEIAQLKMALATDPQLGQLSLDKFSEDVLEAVTPTVSGYVEDSTFEGHCDTYIGTTSLEGGMCVKFNQDTHQYLVRGCSSNDDKSNTCTTAVHSDAICGPRPANTYPRDGLDGDFCEKETECRSGVCKGHRCKGMVKGTACENENDDACAAGLGCFADGYNTTSNTTLYKCKDQVAKGTACVVDTQCVNGHVCVDAKCVEEFSIPDGMTVNRACGGDDVDSVCVSGQCVDTTATTLTCITGYKTLADVPKQTLNKQDCEGTTSSKGLSHNYQFGTLQCAVAHTNSGSYCTPKLGDELGKQLIAAYRAVNGQSQGHCQYLKQLDPYCWHECAHHHSHSGHDALNFTLYKNFYSLLERFANYPSLEAGYADEETTQVYFPAYWGAKNDEHYFDYPGSSAGVLSYLLALLLLLL